MVEEVPYESLPTELGVHGGVTAVIGSGGKTTTITRLAELVGRVDETARVVLTTTTHIRPFPATPLYTGSDPRELMIALADHPTVCCGTPAEAGKLAASGVPLAAMTALAHHVLVEADGSRGLPLKAHAAHEPVIPADTSALIVVVGANGLGHAARAVAHRLELFCERGGIAPDEEATPEAVSHVIAAELGDGVIAPPVGVTPRVLVTHVADAAALEAAEAIAGTLALPTRAVDHAARRLWRVG